MYFILLSNCLAYVSTFGAGLRISCSSVLLRFMRESNVFSYLGKIRVAPTEDPFSSPTLLYSLVLSIESKSLLFLIANFLGLFIITERRTGSSGESSFPLK